MGRRLGTQEATVAYDLGSRIANTAVWPAWNAGIDYGALGAETNAQRPAP